MGEFTNARPDLKLSEYAVKRIRAAWVDGVPMKLIVTTHHTSAAMVLRLVADLPPRAAPKLKRQAPRGVTRAGW